MVKTTLRKRIGAMALCIAMVLSMSAGFTTALAASVPGAGEGALNGKPKLYIDFLGDNKTSETTGVPTDPKNATAPTDDTWKYSEGGNGTVEKTIFWVGVGIDNIDEFILANTNGNKGLSSLELGFYYNSAYVTPYTGGAAGDDAAYLAALQSANISATPTKNQWSSDYEIAAAVSAANPAADSKTDMTVNDPATQEYTPPAGWKMTYLSIHKTGAGANRFADAKTGETNYTGAQYVAMIPFVLKGIDTSSNPALCFRLAMNAFVFSAGSGTDGHTVYGAWEKNTGDHPDNNLKLMLDFTGDLNIFTGKKESTTYNASLVLNNGGRLANTAVLGIWKDPAPIPATISGDGDVLTGLMGGTKMELKLACAKGFSLDVKVTASDSTVVYTKSYPAAANATAYTEYFAMPDKNVTVNVTYTSSGTGDTEYLAKLGITHKVPDGVPEADKPNYIDSVRNKVTMSYTDTAGTAHSVNTDGATLSLPDSKVMTLTVETNSEYSVEIKVTRSGDGTVVAHQTITDQKLYTFTMPAADVTASVTFTKAPHHEAKLLVVNSHAPTDPTANKAKLSFTVKEDTPEDHATDEVYEGYPGTNNVQMLRDGRIVTITIPNTYDKAYAVKSVVVSPKTPGEFIAFDATAVTDNAIYTFAMPKFDAEVTVTFAKVQDYAVQLNIVGATAGCSAELKATDARGQQTTNVNNGTVAMFLGTTVNINATAAAGYSMRVSITRPNGDAIIPGGSAGAWNFVLNAAYANPATDKSIVTVTFTKGAVTKYSATLETDYDSTSTDTDIFNTAGWQGTVNNPVQAEAGDYLTGEINVAPGYYIKQVIGMTAAGATPLTVSGNGYNNGAGTGAGPVTVLLAMPAADVTVTVIYAKGVPPEEPDFQARLVLSGDAAGVGIPFELENQAGATATPGGYVAAKAGERVTGIFRTVPGYYVTKVTATAAAAGVTVLWQWMPDGSMALTMPPSDVTVTVEVKALADPPAFRLTLEKQETPTHDAGNTAALSPDPSGGALSVGGAAAATSTAKAGETFTLSVNAHTGYAIAAVLITDDGGTRPAALLKGGLGTASATASVTMPAGDLKITAVFGDDTTTLPPDPGTNMLIVQVNDTDNADGSAINTAEVFINGAPQTPVAKLGAIAAFPAAPGDTVVIKTAAAAGYSVSGAVVTPAALGITPVPQGGGSYVFTMPAADATAVVSFHKAAVQTYTVDLVLRGAGLGTGTLGAYGTKVYSLSAPAGTAVTAHLFAQAGSYIQSVTVTPAALDVSASFTGAFARQEAFFTMPAADCILNVTLAQGWPDSVAYNATLKVNDPTGKTDNKSMLTNTTQYATTGYLSGISRSAITGQEYAVMEVEVLSAGGFLPEVRVSNSTGKSLAYTWRSQSVLSFAMPADHVTVEVNYRQATASDYTVTLHAVGDAVDSVEVNNFDKATSITWPGGPASLAANPGNAVFVIPTPGAGRYVESSLVMCGGQLIAYQADTSGISRNYFIMPSGNVDVYVTFTNTPPAPDARTAALAVTADAASAGNGTITDVTDPDNPGASVTVPAQGIQHITMSPDGKVQVNAVPGNGYTVTDIRLTPVGSSISQSVPFTWTGNDQVEFTMPAQDVAVEAVLTQNATPAYRAQIVVNGSISGNPDTPAGSAVLRTSSADPGSPVIAGVSPGSPLEAVVTVNPGYIIKSILVVPQLSGGNLTPGINADQNQVVPLVMPTNDIIVYVDFGIDPAAVYSANLTVNHAAASTATSVNNRALISSPRQATPSVADMNTPASAPAAAGELVTIGFAADTGYHVDSYTVTDAGGNTVNCIASAGGFTFIMPAGNADVNVVYTDQAPTARKATLHVTDSSGATGQQVTMTDTLNSVTWMPGLGNQTLTTAATRAVTVTADLPANAYVAAAYALQGDQVYPFTMPSTPGAGTVAGQFFMPSGDVEVYVVLASSATPPPQDYAALLMVKGPDGKNVGDAGSATMTLNGGSNSVTVQSGAAHQYISALPGSVFTVTVTANSGYVIDTVAGTQTTVTPTANSNEYTFTLPAAANVGAIVTLKESASTGKDLTLHVGHAAGSPAHNGNSAKVSYTDASTTTTYSKTVTAADASGLLGTVPSGAGVTLTVMPQAGYYVDAAYALTGTTLVQLSKALEKSTTVNTATFTMPTTATDVYVFYKQGVPSGSWHNVVFLATDVDTDGNSANTGNSKATIAIDGGTPTAVTSNANAANYFNVAAGNSVALQAQAGSGYGFSAVTATPAVTFSPASDPSKTDYTFTMPANNVAVVMGFKPGTVTADLKLTVEDLDNPGTGEANKAEITLTGNTTGTPDLSVTTTSATGGNATKTAVPSGTTATVKVTPASGYTPWAEFQTTPAGGTLQTALVPLTIGAGDVYTGTFTTAATDGELVVHMLKAPKVVILVRHDSGVTVNTGNAVKLSYGTVPPLTATSANAGTAAGISMPIPGGTAGVQIQVAPAAGYQPATVTVRDSSGTDLALAGDNLGDATGTDSKLATFTMPTDPSEVVTITITFGNEITARRLDLKLKQDSAVAPATPAAHGSVQVDWDTTTTTLNDLKLTDSFPAVNIGDTVTVNVAPDPDYRAKIMLESTDAAGQPVTTYLTPDAAGKATFVMPNKDAKLTVEFLKGYTATLVLDDTSATVGNKATMTATSGLPVEGVTVDKTNLPDSAKAAITNMPLDTELTITPDIDETSTHSILKGVMVTDNDSGSTVFLTGDAPYTYTVKSDVTVTVLAEPIEPPQSYLAAVELEGDYAVLGNKATVANATDTDARKGNIWTTAKENERIELGITLVTGYYASITAKKLTDGAKVPLLNTDQPAVPRATLTESGVYHFDMPADNVAITVTYFEKDYIAQLFVVDATGVSGNQAAISYQDRYNQTQRVDYDRGVLVGLQESNEVTTGTTVATDVVSVGVVANNLKTGAILATTSDSGKTYAFAMPDADAAVSAVFGLASGKLRIAAMKLVAKDTLGGVTGEIDITKTNNTATIKNLTPAPTAKSARSATPYTLTLDDGYKKTWVTGYAGDIIEINFKSEQNGVDGGTRDFYTEVTAVTVGNTPLTVLQQGSLGVGNARFIMPDENVQVTVTFDTKQPTSGLPENDLTVTAKGHEGVPANTMTVTDGNTKALTLTPTAGTVTDMTGTVAAVGDNTLMTLTTAADSKYRVASAELSTTVNGVTLVLPLTLDATGKATFRMPAVATQLAVTYATNFSATLHLSPTTLTGVEMAATPGTPASVNKDGGKIEGIPTGTAVKTTASADDAGMPLRAVLATTAGTGTIYLTEAAGTWDHMMGMENVDITAVYDNADTADPDRYVAAVEQSYRPGSTANIGNFPAVSASTPGLPVGDIWTEAQTGDRVTTKVTLAAGYSAIVTAKDANGTVLDVTHRGKTAQSAKVTATGNVTLTMPAGVNVQISVEYVQGYTVTLREPGSNPGTNTYSVTATDTAAVPPAVSGPITGDGDQIKGLKGAETVSAAVTPDAGNEVSAVVITKESGSVFATLNGVTGNYDYTMPTEDITVTPIVSATATDPKDTLYIAAVDTTDDTGTPDPANTVSGIVNTVEKTLPTGTIWAAGKATHQMEVAFTTATNVYVRVTAKTADGSTTLNVLQLGVTGSGKAYFVMPAANVQVMVEYSATPFGSVAADLVSKDHGGKSDNLSTVTYDSTAYPLTPTTGDDSDVRAQIAAVQPGMPMSMEVHRNATYSVRAVELSLTGVTGGPVLSITLDTMGLATVLVPTEAATLTFIYDPTPPTPQPWDPDGLADATATPKLDEGHLTAANHDTLPDTVNVTVPTLYGPDSTGVSKPWDTRVDGNGDGVADPGDFFADFRFYYDKNGTMTELVAGTDVTLGAISYAVDNGYMGAAFTLTGVTADVKKLISDGGIIYATATQQKNTDEAANHPESDKTQLVLPGPGFGPRPYGPGNAAETVAPILEEGYIYAANYGDRAELDIPILIDHKNVWDNAYYAPGGNTDVDFKFYVITGTDTNNEPIYEELTTQDTPDGSGGVIPADIVLTPAADPVETPNPDGTSPDYQGTRFTLALKDGYTSLAAQKLAAMLDNDSSVDAVSKKTRLFVTAILVDKTDPADPKPGPESDKTEVWLPEYMTLQGNLISYAPMHDAELSLRPLTPGAADTGVASGYDAVAVQTIHVKDTVGSGLWSQSFTFKSSELAPRGGTATYMLTVNKTAHIPYERVDIVLDATGGISDFAFTDDIRLIGGDVNGDGRSKDTDRVILVDHIARNTPWSYVTDPADAKWGISVYNPESLAFACDLNGDGFISTADLTIQTAEENFNKTAEDYGAPSGLSFTPVVTQMAGTEEVLQDPDVGGDIELLPAPEQPIAPIPGEGAGAGEEPGADNPAIVPPPPTTTPVPSTPDVPGEPPADAPPAGKKKDENGENAENSSVTEEI